jgi:hypothetical protein
MWFHFTFLASHVSYLLTSPYCHTALPTTRRDMQSTQSSLIIPAQCLFCPRQSVSSKLLLNEAHFSLSFLHCSAWSSSYSAKVGMGNFLWYAEYLLVHFLCHNLRRCKHTFSLCSDVTSELGFLRDSQMVRFALFNHALGVLCDERVFPVQVHAA